MKALVLCALLLSISYGAQPQLNINFSSAPMQISQNAVIGVNWSLKDFKKASFLTVEKSIDQGKTWQSVEIQPQAPLNGMILVPQVESINTTLIRISVWDNEEVRISETRALSNNMLKTIWQASDLIPVQWASLEQFKDSTPGLFVLSLADIYPNRK